MALQNKNHWFLALSYALAVVLDHCFISHGAIFGPFNSQVGIAVVGLLLLGFGAIPCLIPGALLFGLLQATPPALTALLAALHIVQALCIVSLLPLFAPERQIRIIDCNRLLIAGPLTGNVLFVSLFISLQQFYAPETDVTASWLMLWLSQSLAVLIVVPTVYATLTDRSLVRANWLIELTFLVSIAASGGMLLLTGREALSLEVAYLIFPLLMWSALYI